MLSKWRLRQKNGSLLKNMYFKFSKRMRYFNNTGTIFAHSGLIVLEIMENFALRNNLRTTHHIGKANQTQFSLQISKKHGFKK